MTEKSLKLSSAGDQHAINTSIAYGLDDFGRRVCGNAFISGASWQQDQDADTGRDYDPVPAWFGYVPVSINTNN